MPDKIQFIQTCLSHGIPIENAEKAWKKLKSLKTKISTHWDHFEQLREKEPAERLKLREVAAERGIEWTPAEVDDLIEIIGIIQDQMNEEN